MLFMSCLIRFLAIGGMQSFDGPVIRLPQIGDVVAGLELADVGYRLIEAVSGAWTAYRLTVDADFHPIDPECEFEGVVAAARTCPMAWRRFDSKWADAECKLAKTAEVAEVDDSLAI